MCLLDKFYSIMNTSVVNLASFVLVVQLCQCLCQLERNESGKENQEQCDSPSSDCSNIVNEPIPPVLQNPWKPFQCKSDMKWLSLDAIYPSYVEWHKNVLHDATIPCEKKKALIFSPNAGLGDSIGALTSAFSLALKTGRLFFIDWKPYEWTVGLKALPFDYDYSAVRNLRSNSTSKRRLLCVEESHDPSSFLQGHVTNEHSIIGENSVNDYNFNQDGMIKALLLPSAKVAKIIDKMMEDGLSVTKEDDFTIRLVALVIRTGIGEYNQFLSKGDESNFVKCFRNYAQTYIRKSKSKVKFRVFVTSDNTEVKQNAINELKQGDNGDGVIVDVMTLDDSIIHVMQVETKDKKKKSVLDKIRKTYAEYFLIGQCQVMFLTHGSLFGRAAAERGTARESNIHFLSDSKCDGKREKYSYLECHDPKYPAVCGYS